MLGGEVGERNSNKKRKATSNDSQPTNRKKLKGAKLREHSKIETLSGNPAKSW